MWQVLFRLLSLKSQSGFYWDTGPRYGHLTCDSDKPVPTVGPCPCWLSPLSLPHTWRGPPLPDYEALPKVSQSPLKSHFCAEKGKKAHEGGTGGGWNRGPAEILGEKRDWPHYQTWLQLVIRRKESFFVQLTDSEAWVGPVYRRPREWRHTDTQLGGGEEGAEITGVVWVLFDELCQAQD